MKKFLTVCQGGNVRSVSLAYLLKEAGQDAIAASAASNTAETLGMLWDWADYVIVLSAGVLWLFPEGFLHGRQFAIVEVGEDRFGFAFHPELVGMLKPVVDDWAARGWDLLPPEVRT